MGCTPSESLRASTLQCFFDSLCLNLTQQYINYSDQIIPLSKPRNQSLINVTVDQLINDLFVEQWTTEMNYSSYFSRCLPSSCSFSYIQEVSLLYTITVLLSLQGGLAVIVKWACPQIVRTIAKIYQHRKKRVNRIKPNKSLQKPCIEIVDINVRPQPTSDFELESTNRESQYVC
jgi:hypothetical protein